MKLMINSMEFNETTVNYRTQIEASDMMPILFWTVSDRMKSIQIQYTVQHIR